MHILSAGVTVMCLGWQSSHLKHPVSLCLGWESPLGSLPLERQELLLESLRDCMVERNGRGSVVRTGAALVLFA